MNYGELKSINSVPVWYKKFHIVSTYKDETSDTNKSGPYNKGLRILPYNCWRNNIHQTFFFVNFFFLKKRY